MLLPFIVPLLLFMMVPVVAAPAGAAIILPRASKRWRICLAGKALSKRRRHRAKTRPIGLTS